MPEEDEADMGNIGGEEMLAHAAELAAATALPLSADLENGYGNSPQEVAALVRAAKDAGLAGCGIEDVAGGECYGFSAAVERIEAAADAAGAGVRYGRGDSPFAGF